MNEITTSVVIRRPAAEVFSRLMDLGRWPRWQKRLARAEKVSLRPLRAGSQVRLYRKDRRPAVAVAEITHVMPHELFGLKGAGRTVWQSQFVLEPVRGGTRLKLKYEARTAMGFISRLATRMRLMQELQRFRELVEAG